VDGDGQKVVCKCCHKHQPAKNQTPGTPDENAGGNCLCHGAIVHDAPVDVSGQHLLSAPLLACPDVALSGMCEPETYCEVQFRPPSAGRFVRIQLASLLL
jgi:hypothetical protein